MLADHQVGSKRGKTVRFRRLKFSNGHPLARLKRGAWLCSIENFVLLETITESHFIVLSSFYILFLYLRIGSSLKEAWVRTYISLNNAKCLYSYLELSCISSRVSNKHCVVLCIAACRYNYWNRLLTFYTYRYRAGTGNLIYLCKYFTAF